MSSRRVRSPWWAFQVWPALLCTLLILVLGSIRQGPPGPQQLNDKALHFIGFGFAAGLWCRACRHLWPGATMRVAALRGFAASTALGALLELWQAFLPYRSAELLDWVADALGAALAALLLVAFWRLAERGAVRS
ncbi:MAG: VanZ like family [Pseudomonadota bacterium]